MKRRTTMMMNETYKTLYRFNIHHLILRVFFSDRVLYLTVAALKHTMQPEFHIGLIIVAKGRMNRIQKKTHAIATRREF